MKYGSALRDMSAAPVLLGLVIGVAITLLTLGIAGTFGGSDAPAVPPTLVPTVAADEPLPTIAPTIEAPRILARGLPRRLSRLRPSAHPPIPSTVRYLRGRHLHHGCGDCTGPRIDRFWANAARLRCGTSLIQKP